jgi:hypothetical protein
MYPVSETLCSWETNGRWTESKNIINLEHIIVFNKFTIFRVSTSRRNRLTLAAGVYVRNTPSSAHKKESPISVIMSSNIHKFSHAEQRESIYKQIIRKTLSPDSDIVCVVSDCKLFSKQVQPLVKFRVKEAHLSHVFLTTILTAGISTEIFLSSYSEPVNVNI